MKNVGGAGEEREWKKALSALERKLGCRFKDKNLLSEALTHSSFCNEFPELECGNYERLEFFGDAVIELAVSRMLFDAFPDKGEGFLTRARADIVNKNSLAEKAVELGIDETMRLGSGERKAGGATNKRLLASSFEAVVGAAYLDQGWKRTEKMLNRIFSGLIEELPDELRDPRSMLQEWVQAREGTTLEYNFLPATGPAHKAVFNVEVRINGEVVACGDGHSKKQACRRAARAALKEVTS